MKKLIITRDIILDKPLDSGHEGTLIVQQDNIGGHLIMTAANNLGDVLLNPNANTSTVLTWYCDDRFTYWVSGYVPSKNNDQFPYTLPFNLA